jgi:hypothetical protein
MKMDEQAKDLAEFQRQTATTAKNKGKGAAQPPPPPRGTRLSKRLRGATEEEDWQPVPDEWLTASKAHSPPKVPDTLPKTGLESDDESALTSLSDNDEDEATEQNVEFEDTGSGKPKTHIDNEQILDARGLEVPPDIPSDFVEWETVSVELAHQCCVLNFC